jgi:hypothetical protein
MLLRLRKTVSAGTRADDTGLSGRVKPVHAAFAHADS